MQRVTLKQIGDATGVSTMTVSLALRDHARIPEATRTRIRAVAEKLGYRPDPALSALTAYRHEKQTVRDYRTLAFLTSFPTADGWKRHLYSARYFEGAAARAQALGYHIEPFWLKQPGLTSRRIVQILEARGIKGLLLAPIHASHAEVALDWERFCAVSLCRGIASPQINVVDHNHCHSMATAWAELRRRGYRRVGYAIREVSENLTARHWLAAYLMEQQRPGTRTRRSAALAPLVATEWNETIFLRWLRRTKPDVVVSPDATVHGWLEGSGLRVPEDIGFLHLEAEEGGALSGVCQHFANVGVAAVDLLHLELIRSAYGVPSVRQMIGIDGFWVEGTSLRVRPAK